MSNTTENTLIIKNDYITGKTRNNSTSCKKSYLSAKKIWCAHYEMKHQKKNEDCILRFAIHKGKAVYNCKTKMTEKMRVLNNLFPTELHGRSFHIIPYLFCSRIHETWQTWVCKKRQDCYCVFIFMHFRKNNFLTRNTSHLQCLRKMPSTSMVCEPFQRWIVSGNWTVWFQKLLKRSKPIITSPEKNAAKP